MSRHTVVDTEDAFWRFANNANPGDVCLYHTGDTIMRKNTRDGKVPISGAAWLAYMQGLVTLVQKRTHDDAAPFAWLAIRRPYGAEKPMIHDGEPNRTTSRTDWSSKEGATLQAKQIAKFWHDKGFLQVEAWPEPISGRDAQWSVRTNLIGGLPPVATSAAMAA